MEIDMNGSVSLVELFSIFSLNSMDGDCREELKSLLEKKVNNFKSYFKSGKNNKKYSSNNLHKEVKDNSKAKFEKNDYITFLSSMSHVNFSKIDLILSNFTSDILNCLYEINENKKTTEEVNNQSGNFMTQEKVYSIFNYYSF